MKVQNIRADNSIIIIESTECFEKQDMLHICFDIVCFRSGLSINTFIETIKYGVSMYERKSLHLKQKTRNP